ncbi:hypothetical protein [Streptomyces sp. NPDC058989]|uniref:hypothetical protein n=1 Tax=Streptomyces sp. NPDC058989 TaxID=3346686 RepID=UPI0036C12C0C
MIAKTGAAAGDGGGPVGALTTAEREELLRLRRKTRQQEQTIEALGKATACFANPGRHHHLVRRPEGGGGAA